MKRKKVLALAMVSVMALSMTACGGKEESKKRKEEEQQGCEIDCGNLGQQSGAGAEEDHG